MHQQGLFAGEAAPPTPPALPPGFRYQPDFLSADDEARLIDTIGALGLQAARYRQYTAKRRIVSYGGQYDFSRRQLLPAEAIPALLQPLRDRFAEWLGLPQGAFTHAVIAEYATGTQLGWHRDVPDFEIIAGISLAGPCRMRLRPYPHVKNSRQKAVDLVLEPRSAYCLQKAARWAWQHSIPPTKNLRYSITFRTPVVGPGKTHGTSPP